MSAGKSRSRRRGRSSAALPTRPTDRPRRSSRAAVQRAMASSSRVGHLVEVARLDAPLDAPRVDVDAQGDAVVHRDRQRLGAAHPAEARGQRDRAGERAAEAAPGDLGEALVRALEDPLGADVDPRAGRHLPVHREARGLEAPELGPVGPVRHEVGVGEQHARRPLVGAEDTDRLAGLDEHRLVVGERRQRAHHGVERVPRAGGAPGAAVDDEVVGALGDVGVEVVLEHPEGGLLGPAPTGQLGPSGGADGTRAGGHGAHCSTRPDGAGA